MMREHSTEFVSVQAHYAVELDPLLSLWGETLRLNAMYSGTSLSAT